jgi:hypothetical protein
VIWSQQEFYFVLIQHLLVGFLNLIIFKSERLGSPTPDICEFYSWGFAVCVTWVFASKIQCNPEVLPGIRQNLSIIQIENLINIFHKLNRMPTETSAEPPHHQVPLANFFLGIKPSDMYIIKKYGYFYFLSFSFSQHLFVILTICHNWSSDSCLDGHSATYIFIRFWTRKQGEAEVIPEAGGGHGRIKVSLFNQTKSRGWGAPAEPLLTSGLGSDAGSFMDDGTEEIHSESSLWL